MFKNLSWYQKALLIVPVLGLAAVVIAMVVDDRNSDESTNEIRRVRTAVLNQTLLEDGRLYQVGDHQDVFVADGRENGVTNLRYVSLDVFLGAGCDHGRNVRPAPDGARYRKNYQRPARADEISCD